MFSLQGMQEPAAHRRAGTRRRRRLLAMLLGWWRPLPRLDLSADDEALLRRFGIDPADVDRRRRG